MGMLIAGRWPICSGAADCSWSAWPSSYWVLSAVPPRRRWLVDYGPRIQGIGSSIIWPCVLGIASTSVEEDQGFAIGMIMGCITIGNVIGPVIAGFVGGLGEWRLFYAINVILGVLSLVFVPGGSCRRRRAPQGSHRLWRHRRAVAGHFRPALTLDVGADWGWGSFRPSHVAAAVILFAPFPWSRGMSPPAGSTAMRHNGQFLMLWRPTACASGRIPVVLYVPRTCTVSGLDGIEVHDRRFTADGVFGGVSLLRASVQPHGPRHLLLSAISTAWRRRTIFSPDGLPLLLPSLF